MIISVTCDKAIKLRGSHIPFKNYQMCLLNITDDYDNITSDNSTDYDSTSFFN